ncbi:MAG: hypothetical protein ACO268_04100 [Opitutales bacterium]|jgi:tetratricopeptide (TPR) repeat protein
MDEEPSPGGSRFLLGAVAGAALVWAIFGRQFEIPGPWTPRREVALPRGDVPARSAAELNGPGRRTEVAYDKVLADLREGKLPQLNREQVESYLTAKDRSTASLICAFRLTKDLAYLREAVNADGANPVAQLELALRGETAEERSSALEIFRQLRPDNPMGDYLAAQRDLAAGDYGRAAAALFDSIEKGPLADYSKEALATAEDAYVHAGYDPLAAKLGAFAALDVAPIIKLTEVGRGTGSLLNEFIAQNDLEAAVPTFEAGRALGQRLQGEGQLLINQLAGVSIESSFIQQLDPLTVIDASGQTAGERLIALQNFSAEIRRLSPDASTLTNLPREDLEAYFEVASSKGELEALRWLRAQRDAGK